MNDQYVDSLLNVDPPSSHSNSNNNINSTHDNSSPNNNNNNVNDKQQAKCIEPEKNYKLKNETLFRLVDHSVGAIALECGYHIAHQSSLDILTDVCCDYVKKIATLLRMAIDTEDYRDEDSDFVDSLERVFHQINIPSAANLHQFICKMQAIKRHQLKQAQHMTSNPNASASEDQ